MEPRALLEHATFLNALAHSLLREDEALADDVVQETWLAALRRPPRDDGTARSWLGKVCVNFVRRARRGERHHASLGESHEPEGPPSELDMLARRNLARDVSDAVFSLPEPQRSCIVLRYYDGLPPRAIATRLGVPVETVRTRIKRGLATLRGVLDQRYGERQEWSVLLLPFAQGTSLVPPVVGGLANTLGWMTMGKKLQVALLVLLCLGLGTVAWIVHGTLNTNTHDHTVSLDAEFSATSEATPVVASTTRTSEVATPNVVESAASIRSVHGIVVDVERQPIAGARVALYTRTRERPVWVDHTHELGPSFPEPERPEHEVTTDEEGRFAIDDLPESIHELFAQAEGHAPRVMTGVRPSEEELLVILPAARTLRGVVRDLDGRPLPNVNVRILTQWRRAAFSLQTDSDTEGRYEIVGLPDGSDSTRDEWILATKPQFAHLLTSLARAGAPTTSGREFDIYLPRGARLEGRVIDATTGAPLPDADVLLWADEAEFNTTIDELRFESLFGPRRLGEVRTKGDGSFQIESLPSWGVHPAGSHTVNHGVRRLGYLAARAQGYAVVRETLNVPAEGDTIRIEVACWPSIRVLGRVVDPSGVPIEGARVSAHSEHGWSSHLPESLTQGKSPLEVTDESGQYRIDGIVAKGVTQEVSVQASKGIGPLAMRAEIELQVSQGLDTMVPDLILAPPRSAHAVLEVVDVSNRPVAGAVVSCAGGTDRKHTTGTDGMLSLAFSESEANKTFQAEITREGYARRYSDPFQPGFDTATRVHVELQEECVVGGRVVHEDGTPGRGCRVNVYLTDPSHQVAPSLHAEKDQRWIQGTAGTDDEGRFLVRGLVPGPYEVEVIKRLARGQGRPLHANASQVGTNEHELTLTLPAIPEVEPPKTASFEVLLRDASSARPVVQAMVTFDRDGKRLGAHSIAPGLFRLDDLALGPWKVHVQAPSYLGVPWETLTLRDEGSVQRHVFSLAKGITLRGSVRTTSGEALSTGKVFLQAADGGSSAGNAVLDSSGSFEITSVRANGIYTISVHGGTRQGEDSLRFPLEPRVDLSKHGESSSLDLVVGLGGVLLFDVVCPHLPSRPVAHDASEEQARLSRAARLDVRKTNGDLVATQGHVGRADNALVVPAGEPLTATLHVPGHDEVTQEFRLDTRPGAQTKITFHLD